MKNRMQDNIKNNPVLGNPNSDIAAVNAEVHRLQDEAAKDPNHWINDGLKKYFAEERQFLESYRLAKGICSHEFDQETIDHCQPELQAINQRIIKGETTWEQEEAKLLDQWKKLKSNLK